VKYYCKLKAQSVNLPVRKLNVSLGIYLGSCEQLLNCVHIELNEDVLFIFRTARLRIKI